MKFPLSGSSLVFIYWFAVLASKLCTKSRKNWYLVVTETKKLHQHMFEYVPCFFAYKLIKKKTLTAYCSSLFFSIHTNLNPKKTYRKEKNKREQWTINLIAIFFPKRKIFTYYTCRGERGILCKWCWQINHKSACKWDRIWNRDGFKALLSLPLWYLLYLMSKWYLPIVYIHIIHNFSLYLQDDKVVRSYFIYQFLRFCVHSQVLTTFILFSSLNYNLPHFLLLNNH